MAQRQLSTVKGSSKKDKKKGAEKKNNNGEELFDGDGGPKDTRVYAGGARSGTLKVPSTKLGKKELARAKRGGRGRHAFKSKARHKRRKR